MSLIFATERFHLDSLAILPQLIFRYDFAPLSCVLWREKQNMSQDIKMSASLWRQLFHQKPIRFRIAARMNSSTANWMPSAMPCYLTIEPRYAVVHEEAPQEGSNTRSHRHDFRRIP